MTDITAGKVPVLKCFESAWRFLLEHWRLLAPAAAIPALANGLELVLSPAGQAAATVSFAGLAIVAIATVFFTAAVLRKVVREEFVPPWGLAAGQDEVRLLGVALCYALLLLPFGTLFALVFGIVAISQSGVTEAELEAMAGDTEAADKLFWGFLSTPLGVALAVFCLAVIAVITVRLIMVNAATIGERRIVFFQTWNWSKGNVLRMIAAMALTNLPGFLVSVIAAQLFAAITSGSGGSAPVQLLTGTLIGFVGSMLSIPGIALGAILYKGLRPSDFVAK